MATTTKVKTAALRERVATALAGLEAKLKTMEDAMADESSAYSIAEAAYHAAIVKALLVAYEQANNNGDFSGLDLGCRYHTIGVRVDMDRPTNPQTDFDFRQLKDNIRAAKADLALLDMCADETVAVTNHDRWMNYIVG